MIKCSDLIFKAIMKWESNQVKDLSLLMRLTVQLTIQENHQDR